MIHRGPAADGEHPVRRQPDEQLHQRADPEGVHDGPDAYGVALTTRLASSVRGESLPRTTQALLERYLASDLAASGYPVALTTWAGTVPLATFGSAPFDVAFDTVATVAEAAVRTLDHGRFPITQLSIVAQNLETETVTTTNAPAHAH